MFKKIASGFAAIAAMGIGAVQAAPIETALSIVIDGSGSIGSFNFGVQRDAYAAVIGNNTIVKADGSVVVNVVRFSSSATVIQSAIRIEDETDRATVISAINGMSFTGGGTSIASGVNSGAGDMDAFLGGIASGEFASDFRKLIDVSTDGFPNFGDPVDAAVNGAVAAGYAQINCLRIGSGSCDWNRDGVDLDFTATTFADVEAALIRKIGQELGTTPVSEPGALALFGLGLLGLGFAARRRA
ncbi:MAG: VWA domain-containing protein [Pseudomonadota bacterium]